MAALEASVKEAKAARKRHPAGGDGGRGGRRPSRPRSAPARARSDRVASRGAHRAHVVDDRWAAGSSSPTSTRCSTRTRVHQGRGDRLLRAGRAGDAAPRRRPRASRCAATRTGSTGKSFFEKRCPSHRPDWVGHLRWAGRPRWHDRVLRARLDRSPGLGRQPGRARAPRADGPGGRHRVAHDVRVRPRPGSRHRASRSAPRWRSTSETCSTGSLGCSASPRRRARRACSSTCRSTRRTPTSTARRSPWRWPRCSRSTTRDRVTSVMKQGGPAGQGVHRLEPEQPPQDDGRASTPCGPAPTRPCRRRSPGTRSTPRRAGAPLHFEAATCWTGSSVLGDLFAPHAHAATGASQRPARERTEKPRDPGRSARAGPVLGRLVPPNTPQRPTEDNDEPTRPGQGHCRTDRG